MFLKSVFFTLYFFHFLVLRCYCQSNPNYPVNSLTEANFFFPFHGNSPIPRIRHSVEVIQDSFVIIYGGISEENSTLLSDLNIFDLRSNNWSGTVTRSECCNKVEELVEGLGSPNHILVSKLKPGFQGSIPLARADHGSAVIDDLMFIFGGISSLGYLNDFYSFSLTNLKWFKLTKSTASSWPNRRAGHSMVSYSNFIYLFGGRTVLPDKSFAVLNDVWKYDHQLKTWTQYPLLSSTSPAGRQYCGATIHFNQLWIFGGIDSTTGYTFNDLWSYDLTLHQWTQRSLNSGGLYGFIPPPLHHVHLIPAPFNHNLPSLLVYGGISSGGSCGNQKCQPTNRTFYGQLYRYTFTYEMLHPPKMNHVDSIFVNTESTIQINDGQWEFSRIQSNEEFDSGGSGKHLKRYGLESVGYNRNKGTLFEFSGVYYQERDNLPYNVIPKEIDYTVPLAEMKSGEGRNINDGGGRLDKPYWDLYTAEQLRHHVDLPTVSNWWYNELFELNQKISSTGRDGGVEEKELVNGKLYYRNEFYEYTVNEKDFVLIRRQSKVNIV